MPDPIEVSIELSGKTVRVGTLFREASRNRESISFEYHRDWLNHENKFALEPALQVGTGRFYPDQGREMFAAISDSAPDTWGRQLMRRMERRRASLENRTVRTLQESDYLLGVSDIARMGALRLKHEADHEYQAPLKDGVPGYVQLEKLLHSTKRLEREEETDEDLTLIFAPGSSLGGARPKASVMSRHKQLSIAKFPKQSDEYSVETWEHIALLLSAEAGINTADHELVVVDDNPVLLSSRFDRTPEGRLPFLSALSMLQLNDGDRSSYPEIIDQLTNTGANVAEDAKELFRRMVFNILISNVDDHLRNHGFLMRDKAGWVLSPAYDLNPTPVDIKARILTTEITPGDGTCSIELALEQAELFNLSNQEAIRITVNTATAVSHWRKIASRVGQTDKQIDRMASAFEHEDLSRSLSLNKP